MPSRYSTSLRQHLISTRKSTCHYYSVIAPRAYGPASWMCLQGHSMRLGWQVKDRKSQQKERCVNKYYRDDREHDGHKASRLAAHIVELLPDPSEEDLSHARKPTRKTGDRTPSPRAEAPDPRLSCHCEVKASAVAGPPSEVKLNITDSCL